MVVIVVVVKVAIVLAIKIKLTFTERLFCARNCAKYLTYTKHV